MAFMNAKKRNKTVIWVLVILISVGLLASVSIGYFTGFVSTPGTPSSSGTSAPAAGLSESEANQNFSTGSSLMQQGKTEDALKYFEAARKGYEDVVKKDPKNIQSLGDLATTYFYTGNTDKAIETANKALAIEPKFTTVRLNLAKYLFYGQNNSFGAVTELKKIAKGDVNYDAAQQFLAEVDSSKNQSPPLNTVPSNGSATKK